MNKHQIVCVLGLAGFLSAADNWIVSPILPALATYFSTTISCVGFVLTLYLIPYGFMQPVYGFLSDRVGQTRVLLWVVCGLALGTMGCALAPSLPWLGSARFVTGFFAAGAIAVSLAVIGDTFSPSQRQKYVGVFMGIVFLGQGISVGLGGIMVTYLSWRSIFGVFSVLSLIAVFFVARIKGKAPTQQTRGFLVETINVLGSEKGLAIFPLAAGAGFALLGAYSFLGAYLHAGFHLPYASIGIIIMFFGFSCLLTGILLGKIATVHNRKRNIAIGMGLAIGSLALVCLSHHWALALLAVIALGAGYIFVQSTLATIAFDVSSENKGLPSALIGLGLFGGGGIGTAFGSLLLLHASYQLLFLAYILVVLLLLVFLSRIKESRL